MTLFRQVGVEVGDRLGMPYPVDQHDRVAALTRSILGSSQ
jgi:hypothetical protein